MKQIKKINMMIFSGIIILFLIHSLPAQLMLKEAQVMDRGMLHETLYNTGEIAQPWDKDNSNPQTPMGEWPPYLYRSLGNEEFFGANNIWGGGVWIGANVDGIWGYDENARLMAFCGGQGKGNPPEVFGSWSFPILQVKRTNYPLLEDGTLNPDYDPNEAELILTTKWATNPTGVTVTRTARQWSFPDYDDFIIYEYTFTNTGDLNGDEVADVTRTLADVMVQFQYGYAPSSYGYKRYWNGFEWDKEYDNVGYWDPTYWLAYIQVAATGLFQNPQLAGHPEPVISDLQQFAQTGLYGGGLMSPAAVGYCMLYFDRDKLSTIDYNNPDRNQSFQVVNDKLIKFDSTGQSFQLDENDHIKQPYNVNFDKKNTIVSKIFSKYFALDNPREGLYEAESPDVVQWLPNEKWIGRRYPITAGAEQKSQLGFGFGPYYLAPGDSIHFALAEVVGYGARKGEKVIGGLETDPAKQPVDARSWEDDIPIEVTEDGETFRINNYVKEYGYPDYVNSNVRNIQDVAHKAFEAYSGHAIPQPPVTGWDGDPQCWPEDNPAHGIYDIPIPVPAPNLEIVDTDTGTVSIHWSRAVEQFEKEFPDRVAGHLKKFYIFRSNYRMGPWQLLDSMNVGDVDGEGLYQFVDMDRTFKVEETKYYAITSVDEFGNQSGKTNIVAHEKNIGPASQLKKVYVVPNPFVLRSGFTGENSDYMLGFYGLPAKCTIHIFSFSGQSVMTIQHDVPEYSTNWNQTSINNQDLASGVYFFVVETPDGKKTSGKFIIIK